MTKSEERLRRELTELAEALTVTTHLDSAERTRLDLGDSNESLPARAKVSSRRRGAALVSAAAACLAIVAGLVIFGQFDRTETAIDVAAAKGPVDFGEWASITEAPIETRAFAATAWTESEVIFWAGSNLSRNFAYTDGAAYDPVADTWRDLDVPGWGHPGLASAFFDGELYSLAKGSGSRFDPAEGVWTALPYVEGDPIFLAQVVATADGIWGVGPGSGTDGEQRIAISRYDKATNEWVPGQPAVPPAELPNIASNLSGKEASVLWTGSEIVVWSSGEGGLAYNPAAEIWRTLLHPQPEGAQVIDSRATMTNAGLTLLVDTGGTSLVAVSSAEGWQWLSAEVPITDFASVSVSGADDWLVVLSGDESPAVVHMESGLWERDSDSPIGGVEGPNIAWTGEVLVVWGGVATDTSSASGAIWTPPKDSK